MLLPTPVSEVSNIMTVVTLQFRMFPQNDLSLPACFDKQACSGILELEFSLWGIVLT